MKRSEQTGKKSPRKGTLIRTSQSGVAAFQIPALDRFPPPEFLNEMQKNLWVASLSDTPLEFFRARHIPMMIQYVRAVSLMMIYSDAAEADPDDAISIAAWDRMMRISIRLENQLSLNTGRLIDTVVRARSEFRAAQQGKVANEAGASASSGRKGLVYVSNDD
jgi:hypothetical protein